MAASNVWFYCPGKHKTDRVSPIYDWMCTKMEIVMSHIIGIASYHAMLYALTFDFWLIFTQKASEFSAKMTKVWCSVMSLSLIVYPSHLREAILRRISTITQIMACHRMVPSHYPNKLRRNLIWVFIFICGDHAHDVCTCISSYECMRQYNCDNFLKHMFRMKCETHMNEIHVSTTVVP